MSEKEPRKPSIKGITERIICVADQLLADDDERVKLGSPELRAITAAINESMEIDERQAHAQPIRAH